MCNSNQGMLAKMCEDQLQLLALLLYIYIIHIWCTVPYNLPLVYISFYRFCYVIINVIIEHKESLYL